MTRDALQCNSTVFRVNEDTREIITRSLSISDVYAYRAIAIDYFFRLTTIIQRYGHVR